MAWAITGVVLASLGYVGWRLTARSGYESAEYTVVESDGDCEIREYPDLMLASTSMQSETQGGDGSFMRLFGFISGRNEKDQKIAMTVPVFMDRDSDKSKGSMGFVLPKAVAQEGIPSPGDEAVEISKRTGGRFAVIRFSGRLNESTTSKQESMLRKWMIERGLSGSKAVESAGYDPPWTPGPLRRNEILIRLDDDEKPA